MDGFLVFVDMFLMTLLAIIGIAVARMRNLFAIAMLTSIYSLCAACVFVLLDAVDVAFTEAAVGAGITTVLFLSAFAVTTSTEKKRARRHHLTALVVTLVTGALLIVATLDMPEFGSPTAPAQTHPLTEYYIEQTDDDIGIPNIVTAVLASYRGYDTFGEVTVIFTAGIGVLLLLGGRKRKRGDAD